MAALLIDLLLLGNQRSAHAVIGTTTLNAYMYKYVSVLPSNWYIYTPYTGMLSKSRGQILRVAATMHVLFHLDTPLSIPAIISDGALKAAQDFVETSNQHVAFLAGRGDIGEAIDMFQELKKGM